MAHWLCIRIPQLPLAVFSRSGSKHQPLAVSHQGRPVSVLFCNAAARKRGIQPGLTVAAARALAHDLVVRPRNSRAEQQALQALAAWAYQFSSQLSLYPPGELLLEVQGSFSLFGGRAALLANIRTGLSELGYNARLASAPTPLAALSLARCDSEQNIDVLQGLPAALASLPVSVLDWEQALLDRLDGIGVHRLGDLLRLPRDGLARRFGQQSLLYLDRMLGRCPHPQTLYQPPQVFSRRLLLPAEVCQAEGLLFVLQRLLLEMCGWLQGLGLAIQQVNVCLLHREEEVTQLRIGVYKPTRDAAQLNTLLREHLDSLVLRSAVIEVGLKAGETVRLDEQVQDLFDMAERPDDIGLLDRLRARLGYESVTGISAVAEHRPEFAWRYSVPGDSQKDSNGRQRPLWLLPVPRPLKVHNGHPLLQGRLQLQPDRERIESGWWDERDMARDYYIATTASGSCYWIYRELTGDQGWFLQGVFE
jgi:protein ImuB